ncbi:MAG: Hfq-like protein [Pyrinomonadaceae bacterium]
MKQKQGNTKYVAAKYEPKKRPTVETLAETFYYKKQIEAETEMVFVLLDNEEIRGVIEWYDIGALKIMRDSAPNIILLRHNIKYMFKASELK